MPSGYKVYYDCEKFVVDDYKTALTREELDEVISDALQDIKDSLEESIVDRMPEDD